RSKTTPGCLDFWVGVSTGIWVEFKRDESCRLTAEQQEFRRMCEKRGIPTYVVFLAQQAINLVQRLDVNHSDIGRVRMNIEHISKAVNLKGCLFRRDTKSVLVFRRETSLVTRRQSCLSVSRLKPKCSCRSRSFSRNCFSPRALQRVGRISHEQKPQ